MSDAAPTPNLDLARRFAALVALVSEQPAAGLEHRNAAREVVEAARAGPVTLVFADGAIVADGSPLDATLLAERFAAYGLEELGILPKVAQADLLDLARLLAAAPGDGDPPARFAARAAVVDPRTLPRKLRPRLDAPPPEPLPVAQPRLTPRTVRAATPPLGADAAARGPAASGTAGHDPAVGTPQAMPSLAALRAGTPNAGVPIVELPSVDPALLASVLPMPTPSHHALAAALDGLELAANATQFTQALDALVLCCDLAFRQGRDDDLIEGLTAFIAVEFHELARDSSDERRQAFNHALRRLAKPVLLRQLAVLRHRRLDDPAAVDRLQQALRRFGQDGAEAVLDEYASAPTVAARQALLGALRELRTTYDALEAQTRDPRETVVRQAAAVLGALRDARGERMLTELLQHPDLGVRRAAATSLAHFESEGALNALTVALTDDAPLVRLRAVTALAARRAPSVLAALAPLLDKEPDREVLYAAIGAVGGIATPEAVALLMRLAAGEGAHPQRRSAGMRIQACQALVAIRTPTAMAAVQVLRDDRDREVREASMRLVAQASRRATTSSIQVVSEP